MSARSLATLACLWAMTAPAAAPAQNASLATPFVSPSGNIFCLFQPESRWDGRIYPPYLHCEINRFTQTNLRPPDQDCDGDWGGQFTLAPTGVTEMGCYGDTQVIGDAPVLGYGSALSAHGITCRSETSGVTCTNRDGHGFSLSRARQRLF